MSESLGISGIGRECDVSIQDLSGSISARFPWFTIHNIAALPVPEEAYDSRRSQYHSTRILSWLEDTIQDLGVDRLLGVTSFDLYVPGMNFVFGEARRPGRVGIISTHRLKHDPRTESGLLLKRATKEAVHEIGHMLGLGHCRSLECVMYFSNSLADTDRKSDEFCRGCRLGLGRLRFE